MKRRTFLTGLLGLVAACSALAPRWLLPRPPRETAELLADLVPALLETPVDPGHYTSYFRRRMERIPERRSPYRELANEVHRAQREGRPLADLLRPELDWFRQEVLAHYARTDAWISLGYPSWPGCPDAERLAT